MEGGGSTGIVRVDGGCSILEPNQVHMLPCSINYNGPAPVSDYFRPKIADGLLEGVEVKEASFRGRRLLGQTTAFPHDYCGLFLKKEIPMNGGRISRNQSDDIAVDVWDVKALFKDITYWRHDDNPHSIDSGHRFLDWLQLASMMHKKVSAEEVYAEQCKLSKRGEKRKLEET